VLVAQARWPEAEAAARALLELSFEAAQAHFDLWQALEAQAKWPELEAAARAFLAAKPDHPDAAHRLTRALREQARAAPARVSGRRGGRSRRRSG
jgi:hypothetical protein